MIKYYRYVGSMSHIYEKIHKIEDDVLYFRASTDPCGWKPYSSQKDSDIKDLKEDLREMSDEEVFEILL